MCQLLGVCANREVDINFSFAEWNHRGRDHPHGYGFAWYRSGTLHIHKDAASLYEQRATAGQTMRHVRSHIFVAHVRFATVGKQDGSNTHPFRAQFNNREFTFAHNGHVPNIKQRRLRWREPAGETDSEYAFLWLLEQLEDTPDREFAGRLKALADDVRGVGSRFNFLMSDGQTLWAYADHSLHYLERTPPYQGVEVRLRQGGYAIDLARIKAPDERAVLVATEPLTYKEGWTGLGRGELLVVREGRVERRLI